MSKLFAIIDYETFSEAPIKLCGAYEYSAHPSTEILCAAYRIGTRETLRKAKTQLWAPSLPNSNFADLLRSFRDPSIQLVAHNAFFEQVITRNVFGPKYMPSKPELRSIPIERWHCTAAGARSIGIPGNLEGAGAALNLKVQKNPEGKKLIRELCMPRKATKKNPSTRNQDPERLAKLFAYCVQDTDTEVELFLKLPELHPKERKFWVVNQKMNMRGFAVDRKLVTNALKLIEVETNRLDGMTRKLTGGKLSSARQRDAVLKYIRREGVELEDLKAKTVQEYLANTKDDGNAGRELLVIRDLISRSSTAKYAAFDLRSRSDGRARDTLLWFGAHTGRDSGAGVQPQNLPSLSSPSLKDSGITASDVEAGIALMRAGDRHAIEALFPKPMELFAAALRGCIVAGRGTTLEVGDFATIEVRVLFWLADEKTGLEQIIQGRDLYCEMAGLIYGEDPKEIYRLYKLGDKEAAAKRQLGKQTVLGGGFGIGVGGEKFQLTAKQYGMEVSLEIAQSAVRAYREMYPRVPIFWKNIENAALSAIKNPGKRYRIGKLIWGMEGSSLTCTLPIGRKLYYHDARIGTKQTLYGPKPTMEYLGVKSPSKIFGRVHTWGGKLTENVVQAVARDCLYEKLLALEESEEHKPVLAVHDEGVAENEKQNLQGFLKTFGEIPDWAPGLPIKVEGWAEKRYRK